MELNTTNIIYDESLPKHLNNFLGYLKSKNKSVKTIEAYKIDLRLMFRFLKATKLKMINVDLKTVDISEIDIDFIRAIEYTDLFGFTNFLQAKGNQECDRSRKVSAINAFFDYLVKKAKLIEPDLNPSIELDKPKIGEKLPVYLTIEQSKTLLETIKYDLNWKRDYCIVLLFLSNGIRVSELCKISLQDINGDMVTIYGKGNKPRVAYLNPMCIEAIENWLEVRKTKEAKLVDQDSKESLFLNKNYQRLNKQGVENLVKKWVLKAGLGEEFTPHKLRHTCATSKYKRGVDIASLKELLGHKNISTTTIYTHVDSERQREVANINPFA